MNSRRTRFTLDLDPPFQRRLKVMAATKGVTMREYCLAAIEKDLALDETEGSKAFGERLAQMAALQKELFQGRTLPGDSTELIREARQARMDAL